jgi:hypothetical protein
MKLATCLYFDLDSSWQSMKLLHWSEGIRDLGMLNSFGFEKQ